MTINRSRREIAAVSDKPSPKPPRSDINDPSTPVRTQEPVASLRRRSLRRSEKEDEEEVSVSVSAKRKPNPDERFTSLRSGKRVAKRSVVDSPAFESDLLDSENNVEKSDSISSVVNEDKGNSVVMETYAQVLLVESENKEDNGKGIVEEEDSNDVIKVKSFESGEKPSSSMGRRRKYTWEEKGKGKAKAVNVSTNEMLGEEMGIDNTVMNNQLPHVVASGTESLPAVVVNVEEIQNPIGDQMGEASRAQRSRDFAMRNASRFAHFDVQVEEEEDGLSDNEVEQQPVEDWPGPFSTAMKIIRDREEDAVMYSDISLSHKERSSPIVWAPKRNYTVAAPLKAPSLQELSLRVLVKNADAITSLDYVPDAFKVKICQLLCDSRRMDVHVLDLLVRGSPTEICVPDCSWLTEEVFTDCFKDCDTSNLMILQLDQCGRCMPDYVLQSTLAKSPKSLPVLSSLSLSGACRLSDVGLRILVSVAPAIRSINLSQCSLLTSSSIHTLSDSLRSVLRELYINECQNVDLKHIMPALKKFEKLEVLSLVDIPSVKGRLLKEFVTARGHALKQLILTNSVKLTDSSVKDISENCPNLTVLDLANVYKLTDFALGYLANGCQALEKLFFCRNSFSDEAVAAFVETAGGSLTELSLNNVKKVGHNTASSLAKHSGMLQILDVSWCRDMSNDSLGYIVDNCSSLKVLKLFGCTQVTDVFVGGYSNPNVKILGLKMDPFLDHFTMNPPS
ncbi:unnamed protein product [Cochlearia groenlandica]